MFLFSAPVIPQTGLPGGAGAGAGKKAAKVPGFVVSTIIKINSRTSQYTDSILVICFLKGA